MRDEVEGWLTVVAAVLACAVGFALMPLMRGLAWLMRDAK